MNMKNLNYRSAMFGIKMSSPIFVGYLFLGFSYGILMQQQGLALIWTILMSVLVFAGALQYAAIPLLTASFNPLTLFILALSINIRHVFYGLSIFDKYKKTGWMLPILVYTMADESFSINSSATITNKISERHFFFTVSVLGYCYWVLFTTMGHVFANHININIKGLDFVLPALFFALFLNMWKDKANRKIMIFGVIATLISRFLIESHFFILLAMIIIFVGLTLNARKEVDDV
jgi:4-azaleucine resistance transporter AzlC